MVDAGVPVGKLLIVLKNLPLKAIQGHGNLSMQLLSIVTVAIEHYYDCKSNQNYSNSSIKIKNIAKMLRFSLLFAKGCIIIATFVGEMNEALR